MGTNSNSAQAGPPAAAAPKVSKALSNILEKSKVPEEFGKWCAEKKLFLPMDIALLAPTESDVSDIVDACKSHVANHKEHHIEVAIRKVWWYARESLKHPTIEDKRDVLETEEINDLNTRWASAGGIVLSMRERVGRVLMKKLSAMVCANPIEFEVTLLENIGP